MPPTIEELQSDVKTLKVVVLGDPLDLERNPGLANEQRNTNKILKEISGNLKWLTRLVLGMVVTYIVHGVLKGGV